MSTRILGIGLVALCLSGGCDDRTAPQGRSVPGKPLGQAGQAPSETVNDTGSSSDTHDLLPQLSLEDALKEVEYLGSVEGSAVGYSGEAGEFFVLSEILIQGGSRETLAEFLAHDNPVVRVMGLVCLAQTDGTAAIHVLQDHLCDRETVDYDPGGCLYSNTSLGCIARNLLRDANHLGYGELLPLLSPNEMLSLDFEILMDDGASAVHADAGLSIRTAIEEGRVHLDTQSLRLFSDGPLNRIIKAVGRIECEYAAQSWGYGGQLSVEQSRSQQQTQEHLVRLLNNTELDANSYLATASALTRFLADESVQALRKRESFLDGLTEQDFGSRFLATLEERRAHREYMPDLYGQDWRYRRRELYAQLAVMCQCRHPFAIHDIVARCGRTELHGLPSTAGYLMEMAQNVERYQAPWDTYSNVAYVLKEVCLSSDYERQISDTARESIMQAIKPFLEEQP